MSEKTATYQSFLSGQKRLECLSETSSRAVPSPGFTLIEMIVTIAIAAILTALAAPSMLSVLKTNRVRTEASSFINDLMLARTEAVRLGQNVSICASADQATCLGSNTWQSGWIVFPDPSACISPSTASVVLVRVRAALKSGDTFASSRPSTGCITFNREGFTGIVGGGTSVFTLHTQDNLSTATRCISVDLGGHITSQSVGQTAGTGVCT